MGMRSPLRLPGILGRWRKPEGVQVKEKNTDFGQKSLWKHIIIRTHRSTVGSWGRRRWSAHQFVQPGREMSVTEGSKILICISLVSYSFFWTHFLPAQLVQKELCLFNIEKLDPSGSYLLWAAGEPKKDEFWVLRKIRFWQSTGDGVWEEFI